MNKEYGAPSPDVWHSIRFEAVGDNLALYLDGELALDSDLELAFLGHHRDPD